MAVVTIPDEHRQITDPEAIATYVAKAGLTYQRWTAAIELGDCPTSDEVLTAYAEPIETLKAAGGYVHADVVDLQPDTPNLDVMLAKFSREHWHDEDEVRFTLTGQGLFHIHPQSGPVFSVQVGAGDLLQVPRGTWHWFNLCGDRRIRVIRLFQDPSGWTPHYTESQLDERYQPLCLV
jgi:1,2-dihydroxy-3-keto-5-methylthiopentene dioxygenase